MKDKKKINGDVLRILFSVVCIVLAGIFLWNTGKSPEEPVVMPEEKKQEEEAPEIVTIVVSEELAQDEDEQVVISGGIIVAAGEPAEVQPIQEAPKEAEEPKDPPALAEGTDLADPDKVPEYAEDPKPTEKPADTVVTKPSQDDGHPGQMYIEGFGWVTIGGGNTSIYDPDMYLSGEHIGDM